MQRSLITTAASVALAAAAASGQSASVSLVSSNDNPSAGDTITITLQADFDLAGAGSGVFGDAGLYGFGGDVALSGDAPATAAAPAVNAQLDFGQTASVPAPMSAVRAAAGRGLEGGITPAPIDLLSFDVTIDPGAASGSTIAFDYEGAVVLALDSNLTTFATDPGMNQQTLAAATLTLTVGGGCNQADLAEPFGVLDLGDISAFIAGFTTGDPSADLAAPFGVFDLNDISAFLASFTAGCP